MKTRTRILSNSRVCMGWLWLLLFLASSSSVQAASPIPEGRRIDWSNTGVPGGIPNRTTIFATIDADTYGNGTTDAGSVINAASAECPADQVVYLPRGTYRLNSSINFRHKGHVTLRGTGMGKTVLKPADGSGAAITTGQAGLSSERKILSGSTKGSRSINVEDASGIEPGMILDIVQDDDSDFFWARGSLVNHTGQFVMVTAVDGATIRFEDPLVWSFTLNPRCRPSRGKGMRWCGVEDLTVSAGSSCGGGMLKFWHAYASWIKNVETAWGKGNDHIRLCGGLRCEIRECHIHDTHSTADGYGILTMSGYGGPRGGCTGTLIENNIFSGLRRAIILETEVGSVVG